MQLQLRELLDPADEVAGAPEHLSDDLVVDAVGSPPKDAALERPKHITRRGRTVAATHRRHLVDPLDGLGRPPEPPSDLLGRDAVSHEALDPPLDRS
jgi:hypothetical protein